MAAGRAPSDRHRPADFLDRRELLAHAVHAVIDEPAGRRFVPIECNPRFNGASYPSGIACRLHVPQWVSKDFTTRHRDLSDLELGGLEFDTATDTGIVLVNWGTICVGKIGVLIAGPPKVQEQLENDLRARL